MSQPSPQTSLRPSPRPSSHPSPHPDLAANLSTDAFVIDSGLDADALEVESELDTDALAVDSGLDTDAFVADSNMGSYSFLQQPNDYLPPSTLMPDTHHSPVLDVGMATSTCPQNFHQQGYTASYPQRSYHAHIPSLFEAMPLTGVASYAFPNIPKTPRQRVLQSGLHLQDGLDYLQHQFGPYQSIQPLPMNMVAVTSSAENDTSSGTYYASDESDYRNGGVHPFRTHHQEPAPHDFHAHHSLLPQMTQTPNHIHHHTGQPIYEPVHPQDIDAAVPESQKPMNPAPFSDFSSSPPEVDDMSNSDTTFRPDSPPRAAIRKRKKATSHQHKQTLPSKQNTKKVQTTVDAPAAPPEIGPDGLRYTTFAAAKAAVENRAKLSIEEDDWQKMNANPVSYVLHIMSAFKQPVTNTPRDKTRSTAEQQRWNAYQQAHIEKVNIYSGKNESRIELAAWMLFGTLIEAHRNGIKGQTTRMEKQKCSTHLAEIWKTIKDYAIVRWDLIRLQRIEELVASPQASITRKLANFYGNTHKKARDEENAAFATEKGVPYNRVLGLKRKSTGGNDQTRKRKRAGEDDEGLEAEESVTNEPPSTRKKTSKPQAAVASNTDTSLGITEATISNSSGAATQRPKRNVRKIVYAGADDG